LYISGTYEQIKAFKKSNKYKTLSGKVGITFKPVYTEIVYREEQKTFDELLLDRVVDDKLLHSFYRAITEHLDKYLII